MNSWAKLALLGGTAMGALAFLPGGMASAETAGTVPQPVQLAQAATSTTTSQTTASTTTATPLDAITVTATKTETTALEAPASVTVVDREEIERSQATSLDDAIRHVPGVEMSGGPRSSAEQPNIRGLGGSRVVIISDGVRKNFESGHRGRVYQDMDLVDQIDILRGPSSMLYGSGALGGVINMETKDARDLLDPGQTVGGQAKTGFQSNGSHRLGSLTAYAAPDEHVDFLVSGSRRSNGDQETGTGQTISYSNDSSAAGLGKVKLQGRGHEVELTAESYLLWNEIPTAPDVGSGTSLIPAERFLRENSASLRYGFDAPDSALIDANATLYYSDTFIREMVTSPGTSNGRNDSTALETMGMDLSNTSRFDFADGFGLALTYGGELYNDSQEGKRNGAYREQYPIAEATTSAAYTQAEFTLFDHLTVTPGVRFDQYEREAFAKADVSESELSKKLALSYRATSFLTLFGSYSEAFRAPELTELYAGGVHFSMGPFANNVFIANPNLRPETAENKEVGLAMAFDDVLSQGDALRMKGSVYRNDVKDYIDLEVLTNTTQAINVRNARIEGGELEAGYDANRWFSTLGYSHIEGENTANGAALATIPEDKLALLVGWRIPGWDTTLGWRGALLFGQDQVPSGTDKTEGRKAIHDVFVSWEPTEAALDGLRLDFAVDNVFDKSYRRHLASQYETGRNFMLTASMRF